MNILIVNSNVDLTEIWARYLLRKGYHVTFVHGAHRAIEHLNEHDCDVMVLELGLSSGGALAVADIAVFRNPAMTIIPITEGTLFSDGSVFEIVPNARGMLSQPVNIADLENMIEHCLPAETPAQVAIRRIA